MLGISARSWVHDEGKGNASTRGIMRQRCICLAASHLSRSLDNRTILSLDGIHEAKMLYLTDNSEALRTER